MVGPAPAVQLLLVGVPPLAPPPAAAPARLTKYIWEAPGVVDMLSIMIAPVAQHPFVAGSIMGSPVPLRVTEVGLLTLYDKTQPFPGPE